MHVAGMWKLCGRVNNVQHDSQHPEMACSSSRGGSWKHLGAAHAEQEYTRLDRLGYFRCPSALGTRASASGQRGVLSDAHSCWCDGCPPVGSGPSRARRILEWAWRGGVRSLVDGKLRHTAELTTFEPHSVLRCLRGKTVFFVGDSLGYSTFESFACLLWEAGDARRLPEVSRPHVPPRPARRRVAREVQCHAEVPQEFLRRG